MTLSFLILQTYEVAMYEKERKNPALNPEGSGGIGRRN